MLSGTKIQPSVDEDLHVASRNILPTMEKTEKKYEKKKKKKKMRKKRKKF